MESESQIQNLQRNSPHNSEDTEKMEKIESEINSVDIQSSTSKPPKTPELRDEKEDKIDQSAEKLEAERTEMIPEIVEKVNLKSPHKENNENPLENNENDISKKFESKPALGLPKQNEEEEKKDQSLNEKSEQNETKDNGMEKDASSNEKIESKAESSLPKQNEEEEKKQQSIEEKPDKEDDEKRKKSLNKESQTVNILAAMPGKSADLFLKNAEKKKQELEIEQKNKKEVKPSKKRILSEVEKETLEMKKKRFAVVKHWDNERSLLLNQAILFVDRLLIKLDQKIRDSNLIWHNLTHFFKERIAQEIEYVRYSSKLAKLAKGKDIKVKKEKEKNNNSHSKEELTGLEKILEEMDEAHIKKAKSLADYCAHIEKRLIGELLKEEIDNSEKEINANKKKIDGLKKNLSEMNFQTAQKAKLYSKLYSETVNDEDFEISEKKDLFSMEMNFVHTASKQSQAIRDLLIGVIEFIQGFIKLEKKKQETIKTIIEDYLKMSIQAHGTEIFGDLVKKLGIINEKDVEGLHHLHTFVTQEDLKIFRKDFENLETFKKFITEEFKGAKPSDEFSLSKAKFKAFVKTGQLYESSWLFFTRDRNLLIWKCEISGELSENEATSCIKVEGLGVYAKEKENNIVEIVQSVPGLIFNTKKTTVVKTEDNETLTQIIASLQKK